MDRNHNAYGTPKIPANPAFERSDSKQRKHQPFVLSPRQRKVVDTAVREACDYRKYHLRAINVRTNHAHTVVTAMQKPEPVLSTLKSYSTRALSRAGLLSPDVKPWARHGSTIYLWKEEDVAKAIAYVLFSQGDELFNLDDQQWDDKTRPPLRSGYCPLVAADRGFIDEVIEPAQTRPKLIRAIPSRKQTRSKPAKEAREYSSLVQLLSAA